MEILFLHSAKISGVTYSYPDTLDVSDNIAIPLIDSGVAILNGAGGHSRSHSIISSLDHSPAPREHFNKLVATNELDGSIEYIAKPTSSLVNAGEFKGTCDLRTDPGTPVADEWWSATEVGIYTLFGGVEVITMDEVFNYIKWSQSGLTWSLETVAINSAAIQIPKVTDGLFDLFVNKNYEIGVQAYAGKKLADPSFPYFYSGTTTPSFHSRLNLDGDLYLSKLFANEINLPNGTALKWLTLDAQKNIAFSDAPSGGVTPTDGILDWDTASSKYMPYADKKGIDPAYAYLYTGTTYPTFTRRINLDGWLFVTSLLVGSATANTSIGGGAISTSASGARFKFDHYAGVFTIISADKLDTDGVNFKSIPVRIGSNFAIQHYNNEYIDIDDYNRRFDINMTNIRFNKGTASKWLTLNASKEIAYADAPLSGGSADKLMIWNNATSAKYNTDIYTNTSGWLYAKRFQASIAANDTASVISMMRSDTTTYGSFASYVGDSAADKTQNISTQSFAGFTYAGMVKILVNGDVKWMPYYN